MTEHGEALVLGAGVSGLTTALSLQEQGLRVRIVAARPPRETVSAVAAAIWYPYKALPEAKVAAWGSHSFAVFEDLARREVPGVSMRTGLDLLRAEAAEPFWGQALPTLERCPAEELPPGYPAAWKLRVPLVETSIYLAWQLDRFRRAGGTIETRTVSSLDEVARGEGSLLFNCTGLESLTLLGDRELVPVKGQVVVVRNPGLTDFLLDEDHPQSVTYVIPRTSDCVLGGSAEEGSWDARPDPAVADAILARCIELEPRLEGAEVLEHKAGLRPVRSEVRVELELLEDGTRCVHNYGHGGAGITLSWGCAQEAVALALGGSES